MSWMDSKLHDLKLAEEEKRRANQDTPQQGAAGPQPSPAWEALIAAVEKNIAEWNQAEDKPQLHLTKSAIRVSLHNAGQLGSILDLTFEPQAGIVKYSAPTKQANHWKRHSGEIQITPQGLFVSSSGNEIPKPLNAEQTSQFLLEPVLFA